MISLVLSQEEDPLDAFYFGKIEILGDIISPIYSDEELEQFERSALDVFK